MNKNVKSKSIWKIYSLLRTCSDLGTLDFFKSIWEEDIGVLTEREWEDLRRKVSAISVFSSQCTSLLYLVYRAFYSPSRLKKRWAAEGRKYTEWPLY